VKTVWLFHIVGINELRWHVIVPTYLNRWSLERWSLPAASVGARIRFSSTITDMIIDFTTKTVNMRLRLVGSTWLPRWETAVTAQWGNCGNRSVSSSQRDTKLISSYTVVTGVRARRFVMRFVRSSTPNTKDKLLMRRCNGRYGRRLWSAASDESPSGLRASVSRFSILRVLHRPTGVYK